MLVVIPSGFVRLIMVEIMWDKEGLL